MTRQNKKNSLKTAIPLLIFLAGISCSTATAAPFDNKQRLSDEEFQKSITEFQENMRNKMQEKMKNQQRRKIQDKVSGLPDSVVELQSLEPVRIPPVEAAIPMALKAATEKATPLIDTEFHKKGKTITIPNDFKTIQEGINAAKSGDTVVVKAGTYYEQLVMKDGVRLISDDSDNGNELMPIPGAHLKLPKRALRTIIDGSKSTPSKHGMIDFDPGLGRKSVIDGFTIRNLPMQNHHIPGHAHGLNVRGASPVIMNNLIHHMGSTGIGSHVVYNDQESKMPDRDFRWNNIKHQASAVLYNNVIHSNVGLGIGCNHFSSPYILGNEVYDNNDSVLGEGPTPGMGNKHGSFATIIGNIVHNNPGGGIMAQGGDRQGRHGVDRPTHPTISNNVIYDNGDKKPGISAQNAGSEDTPVIITGNYVYRATSVGIGLSNGAVGIIEDNMVMHSEQPDITVKGATALKLNRNKVIGKDISPGITIVNESVVHEMIGNAVETVDGPRFMVEKKSKVYEPESH